MWKIKNILYVIRILALSLSFKPTSSHSAETWVQILEGRWAGKGLTLTFDQGCVMANRDPAKPFDWRAFHLVTTVNSMIVFDIGEDRFIGSLDGKVLTVTKAGQVGSWRLTKIPAERPN